MHTASQIFAHRAQPAARNKARWQPYNSLLPTRSPTISAMNTPKPSVTSSPPPTVNSTRYHPQISHLQVPKEPIQRDVKHKFASGLIDQAVKTLSEIWRPEDIPSVFVGPSNSKSLKSLSQSIQPPTPQVLVSTGAESDSALPLKNFVHEVLKRSRTSGSVLQTALCYLEAIRTKIPEILRDEKVGIRAYFMPESTILPATEAEVLMDRKLSILEGRIPMDSVPEESLKTVRVADQVNERPEPDCDTRSIIVEPAVSSVSVASPLPSPLLCPRRTFLAALILASKFSQDKCYSNRAWAKLSGLPPREIGRCERALGQALDWRLWVGKKASATTTRPVLRSQSENCIVSTPSHREPFLCPSEPKPTSADTDGHPSLEAPPGGGACRANGLRRSATVPAESFDAQRSSTTILDPGKASNGIGPSSSFDMMDVFEVGATCEETHKQTYRMPIPYAASDSGSSSSSTASPDTPPLSYSPSTSGDRTIQVSSEEGNFPSFSGSQWLDISDPHYIGASLQASPDSLLQHPKLARPNLSLPATSISNVAGMEAQVGDSLPGKMPSDVAEAQIGLTCCLSDPVFTSCLGIAPSPHLWHADGGHVPMLETMRVH